MCSPIGNQNFWEKTKQWQSGRPRVYLLNFNFISADCTWDFFRCKGSDVCCKQRFDSCCKCVMNPDMCAPATTTPEPTPPTTTPRPPSDDTTTPPATCMHPSTLSKIRMIGFGSMTRASSNPSFSAGQTAQIRVQLRHGFLCRP